MRIATQTETVYTFSELSESAQETALDNLRDINTFDSFWHECAIDNIKELAGIIGIDIDNVWFSGFYSQGDGACFDGFYSYAKGAAKAIRAECPRDSELHGVADGLQEIQRRHFYRLSASVSCFVRVYIDGDYADAETDETVTELLRDFMRWSYKVLRDEYEYLCGDEAVRESIEANEYEFTVSGEVY